MQTRRQAIRASEELPAVSKAFGRMISIQAPFSPNGTTACKGDGFQQPGAQVRFRQVRSALGPTVGFCYRLPAAYAAKWEQVL